MSDMSKVDPYRVETPCLKIKDRPVKEEPGINRFMDMVTPLNKGVQGVKDRTSQASSVDSLEFKRPSSLMSSATRTMDRTHMSSSSSSSSFPLRGMLNSGKTTNDIGEKLAFIRKSGILEKIKTLKITSQLLGGEDESDDDTCPTYFSSFDEEDEEEDDEWESCPEEESDKENDHGSQPDPEKHSCNVPNPSIVSDVHDNSVMFVKELKSAPPKTPTIEKKFKVNRSHNNTPKLSQSRIDQYFTRINKTLDSTSNSSLSTTSATVIHQTPIKQEPKTKTIFSTPIPPIPSVIIGNRTIKGPIGDIGSHQKSEASKSTLLQRRSRSEDPAIKSSPDQPDETDHKIPAKSSCDLRTSSHSNLPVPVFRPQSQTLSAPRTFGLPIPLANKIVIKPLPSDPIAPIKPLTMKPPAPPTPIHARPLPSPARPARSPYPERPVAHKSTVAAAVNPTPPSTSSVASTSNHRVTSTKEPNDLKRLTINNKVYFLLSLLGHGGSAKVYQVYDSVTHNNLAVKVVDLTKADASVRAGYENEIALLIKLNKCERVVRLIDYERMLSPNGETKRLFLVMEKGDSDLANVLKQFIEKTDDPDQKYVVDSHTIKHYWKEMLKTVHEIHSMGIVHSDLKPVNFITVSGKIKLIDFGIANAIQADHTSVIKDNQIGTLNYMAPEALQSRNELPPPHHRGSGHQQQKPIIKFNCKADIWSLGCILYNLVYGTPPFGHILNLIPKVAAITNPSYPIHFPDREDKHLVDCLKKCLDRDPYKRPDTRQLLQHPYLKGEIETKKETLGPNGASNVTNIMSQINNLTPNRMNQLSKFMQQLGP